MCNLSLTRRFALISFNGERVKKTTSFTSLKERCMVTALLLDFIVCKKIISAQEYDCRKQDSALELNEYEKAVSDIWKANGTNSDSLSNLVSRSLNMPVKEINKFYKKLIDGMVSEKLMDIIPSLLECDLYYQTSGVKINEYRSDDLQYQNTVNELRKMIVEEDAITDENISLVWLLKQSGDLSKIFTLEEVHQIDEMIKELCNKNNFVEALFAIKGKGSFPRTWKAILTYKKELAKTPIGSGIVSRIPILVRSESIFIETERMFPDSWERVEDVKNRLESNGHICKVKAVGGVSFMEIDHVLYELVPDAVVMKVMNIHGVRLRRHVK
ncbi:hypothetical protein [Lacrimispora sp.]|uniref:hypothetical protein n=1 Tax=Lacrimispora sp. TaxID=2719234 RepID=UPI0032E4CD9E